MSYAERARRFLAEGYTATATIASADEINAVNEQRVDAVEMEPIPIWWIDRVPAGSSPILYLPPQGCLGPRVCSRIGPCERHLAGNPCEITT